MSSAEVAVDEFKTVVILVFLKTLAMWWVCVAVVMKGPFKLHNLNPLLTSINIIVRFRSIIPKLK